LVILGRVAPETGIDVLLRALRLVKTRAELDIYGIKPGRESEKDMEYRISDIGNAQVRWLPSVKPEQVVETIRKYDTLVVPSVWLETGPLVVLEAFAAGVPVIGSRLGGIAEMVKEEKDGFLFRAGDPSDLAKMIEKTPIKLSFLKKNIKKPESCQAVAAKHFELYQQLFPAHANQK
jgi:glycosyltransferase involved in cell wall biosynthesis